MVELVVQNRETNEENDEDCFGEGFQLARLKFDRDVEGGREGSRYGVL